MHNITKFLVQTVNELEHTEIKEALLDSYNDSAESLTIIENFFKNFTSTVWPQKALQIFCKNWRTPAIGSASFCALILRVLKLAEKTTNLESRNLLYLSAAKLADITYEDVGLDGVNHQELYEQFAFNISNDDSWKLKIFSIPNIKNFLADARSYRQNGVDLTRAILISIPEELYNHGEFSFISPLFTKWYINILKRPRVDATNNLKYLIDHTGNTEHQHFSSAVDGLESYCQALDIKIDMHFLYEYNLDFINNMAIYYQKLMSTIKAS